MADNEEWVEQNYNKLVHTADQAAPGVARKTLAPVNLILSASRPAAEATPQEHRRFLRGKRR